MAYQHPRLKKSCDLHTCYRFAAVSAMAGLPRSFGPDVSDNIMRFAVGYPRDRLRDITSTVTHRGAQCRVQPWTHDVSWRVDAGKLAENLHSLSNWSEPFRGRSYFCVSFDTRPPPQIKDIDSPRRGYDHLEYSRGFRVQRLYSTCGACEPVELQIQRPRF